MTAATWLRGAGLAALALAFLMPGHYLPWASFQGQWIAALGAALGVLGAAAAAARAGHGVPVSALALLAFASALIPPLQWLTGQIGFASDALLPAAYFVAFGLALVGSSAWTRVDRVAWLDHLFLALIVAGGVSVAIALQQWLSIGGGMWMAAMPPGGRPFANLGQPNHLALLLCLGIVGTLRAHHRELLGGATASLLTAWFGLGLVMTQSRTGWLIVVLLVLWWALMRRRARLTLPSVAVLVGFAGFALTVASWDAINDALLLQGGTLAERMQGGTRPRLWAAMLEAISRSPWVGYGFNQVSLAQQAVAVDMPAVQEMAESAHNVVLDLAIWAGLPFMLLWVGTMLTWLAVRIRACRMAEDWFVLAAIGAILTHAMLEYPLEHAYFLLPLGLFMGSLAATTGAFRLRISARHLAGILPFATVALLFVGAEYLRVEQANRHVRLALFGIGDLASPEAAPPGVWLLDAPREYHRLMLTPAREDMSANELDWMRRVTMRHAFPPAMLRYALAAGLNGQANEAALTLRRLCSMHAQQRCDEARAAWRTAQSHWPALGVVPVP